MSIHESLQVVEDYQKHFRLREMSGRAFAEDINYRYLSVVTLDVPSLVMPDGPSHVTPDVPSRITPAVLFYI